MVWGGCGEAGVTHAVCGVVWCVVCVVCHKLDLKQASLNYKLEVWCGVVLCVVCRMIRVWWGR